MAFCPEPTTDQIALADCYNAWEGKDATWGWCIHHEMRLEPLSEPIEKRIDYITAYKPSRELESRFNNLRPVLSPLPEAVVEAGEAYLKTLKEVNAAYESPFSSVSLRMVEDNYMDAVLNFRNVTQAHRDQLDALHRADVPNHTWNGESIFEREVVY